jgi:hypothetical protein
MSERERREGNTDAPRVDTNEVRGGESRSGSGGPRRVEDVRHDRESERNRREGELGTSWTSVIFGWLAALGAGLILSGIVGAIVGGILGALGVQGGTEGGVAALVGLLVTLLLAFLIGGYVAGRLASRSGVKHGILVPLLSLLVILLLGIIGTIVGSSFIDQLSGVALPQVPQGAQQQAPQNLGAILTGTGILALLVPFIGGALGGAWGAKTGRNRPY